MILLHSVIREVDVLIVEVFHVELFGSRADVPVLKPVTLLLSVKARHKDVASDIKLALLIQEWHNIFLDYVSPCPAELVYLIALDYIANLLQ